MLKLSAVKLGLSRQSVINLKVEHSMTLGRLLTLENYQILSLSC